MNNELRFVCVKCGKDIKIKYMDSSMKCPMCKRCKDETVN